MERKRTDILKEIAYLQSRIATVGKMTIGEKVNLQDRITELEQDMHAMFNDPKPRVKLWVG